MKILQTVKKISGGLMVVPLLLGAIVSTFSGNVLWNAFDDTFITYLWKSGAVPTLAAFIFCNVITINFKKTGVTVCKGMLITAVEVGVGIIIRLVCDTLFGEKGFLGLSTLAIVGTLANSNGGLYAALVGKCGDAIDVSIVSILSISDDPFFAMVALGATGIVKIPVSILIDCTVPVIVGYVLGNLDEDIRKLCKPSATILIPFFAFPPGAGPNIVDLLEIGGPEILLGIVCAPITGLAGYLVYKLLRIDRPEMGRAIGTITGNATVMPALVAAMDATLLTVAEAAAAQITAAIIVTAILCPVLVSYLRRIEACKRGR